jgi:cell wall-associated NlpC family hydrolase
MAEMNSPGYWISRHPNPDGIIMDGADISAFNALIRESKTFKDLANLGDQTGDELRKELTGTIDWIAGAKIFQSNGKRVAQGFMSPLIAFMNLEAIPPIVDPRYGFLTAQTDLRVLPTSDALGDEPGDVYIDNLQGSSLEWGSPVVILHASSDQKWFYCATELLSGWIPSERIAVCSQQDFVARYWEGDFWVVTESRGDLYGNEKLTDYRGSIRMGAKLIPLPVTTDGQSRTTRINGPVPVLMPLRQEDGSYSEGVFWIEAQGIHRGYLAYTPRNVYLQAFKQLHSPYGWGGTFGERDCSQYLWETFAVMGIKLPRNSSRQAKAGSPIPGFTLDTSIEEKSRLLTGQAIPGATLLRLPGHIMLYLGSVNGKPYVIHSTWAYGEKRGWGEIKRLINRVVVSTLELGDGTEKGTHLKRLTTATRIALP